MTCSHRPVPLCLYLPLLNPSLVAIAVILSFTHSCCSFACTPTLSSKHTANMQFFLISALAGSAVASNFLTTLPRELRVRQTDESFIPDSQTVSACASNEIECPGEFQGSIYCSEPSRGDTCCPQGCKHSSPDRNSDDRSRTLDNCPGTNFCLIDGYCCPEVSLTQTITELGSRLVLVSSREYKLTIYHRVSIPKSVPARTASPSPQALPSPPAPPRQKRHRPQP